MKSKAIIFSRAWRISLVAAILGAFIGLVAAQGADPAAMAGQYAAKARENAALTRQFTWQMRVEITLKGETKPALLFQMRYDLDGKLQKTLLTAPSQKKPSNDAKEWAEKLVDLVQDYLAPSPGKMMDFYIGAAYAKSPDGRIQASGSAFIQPSDKVTFWVDAETKAPVRYEFQTVLDGDAVSGKVDFGQAPNGPQYAARLVIDVPAKKVSAKIENFKYERQ
ncbi:MAG: hypothetical protein KA419_13100 [Acidobacteria bacterium]|nr:hypothetical protein [Acidobacteriota bacterium]